ncbi:MAG: hypothetical protein OEW22_09395 [Rubrivivax sp.]|nr:hypothetical protein [Rubrivivax sp.]
MTDTPVEFLGHEARALLARLDRMQPFVLSETMVPAANLSPAAQRAIDHHLWQARRRLHAQGLAFIAELPRWRTQPAEAQRRFALLRLRFNAVLTQFDLFADALAQRGERNHGVWMSGLDALAADALMLPAGFEAPPVVCYLDRGIGAAIRRARTRLPGGGANPAALIRVPRERMVGSGIASSLVHEVGHQAAALLGLVDSLRAMLRALELGAGGAARNAWRLWSRWISEIVADFWSVARLGIAAPLGLIGVLSLPRPFVFRISIEDPHPTPWLRVLLSCCMGHALYPDPAWARLAGLWQTLYPLAGEHPAQRAHAVQLARAMPGFVARLAAHRAPALGGRRLDEALAVPALQPAALAQRRAAWRLDPGALFRARPCLACAAIGQARAEGGIGPQQESRLMGSLLTHWALRNSLGPQLPARQFLFNPT